MGLLIATYQGARALANSAIPLTGTVLGHALLVTAGLAGYILHGVFEGSLGWFWASTSMIGGWVGGKEAAAAAAPPAVRGLSPSLLPGASALLLLLA